MAMTVADCLRIEAARKAARRRLMLNFSIRFSGAARAIRPGRYRHKVLERLCFRVNPVKGEYSSSR